MVIWVILFKERIKDNLRARDLLVHTYGQFASLIETYEESGC